MVIVGKHINDISINPLEYLLNSYGDPMEFENEEEAEEFLREKGVTDEEMQWIIFESI